MIGRHLFISKSKQNGPFRTGKLSLNLLDPSTMNLFSAAMISRSSIICENVGAVGNSVSRFVDIDLTQSEKQESWRNEKQILFFVKTKQKKREKKRKTRKIFIFSFSFSFFSPVNQNDFRFVFLFVYWKFWKEKWNVTNEWPKNFLSDFVFTSESKRFPVQRRFSVRSSKFLHFHWPNTSTVLFRSLNDRVLRFVGFESSPQLRSARTKVFRFLSKKFDKKSNQFLSEWFFQRLKFIRIQRLNHCLSNIFLLNFIDQLEKIKTKVSHFLFSDFCFTSMIFLMILLNNAKSCDCGRLRSDSSWSIVRCWRPTAASNAIWITVKSIGKRFK